jgi:putative nucleotidyltransferase with HDIG domain
MTLRMGGDANVPGLACCPDGRSAELELAGDGGLSVFLDVASAPRALGGRFADSLIRTATRRHARLSSIPQSSYQPDAVADAQPMLSPRPWGRILERVPTTPVAQATTLRAAPYVLLIAASALASGLAVHAGDGVISLRSIQSAVVLAAFGVAAELLNYQSRGGASRSIAFIPFAATALLAPNGVTLVIIGLAVALVQLFCRRHWLKSIFNVAQIILATSAAILTYRSAGGTALAELRNIGIIETLWLAMVPSFLMMTALIFVNSATVSGVIALTEGRKLFTVWRASTLNSAPFYFLTTLVTFYLAWLYAQLGPAGAIGLVIPLVGIRQLYKTTTELTNVTEELLDLMVAAIEARDPYTSGHSKRVARASRIIAQSLGMKAAEVERVGVAALLHDVGKIDEAFAPILAKEGRLTPDEWELMKRHPVRSAELVGMLSSLQDVVKPVRHHHENYDGTGYPSGLKGEEIPTASRIIMFADTLDAMTTDRPYRKALGMNEARAEFVKFRGRQFDPRICDRVVSDEVWADLYASFSDAAIAARQKAS